MKIRDQITPWKELAGSSDCIFGLICKPTISNLPVNLIRLPGIEDPGECRLIRLISQQGKEAQATPLLCQLEVLSCFFALEVGAEPIVQRKLMSKD